MCEGKVFVTVSMSYCIFLFIFFIIFTDIYHGRGNGGECIYGTVFEGKY